MLCNCRCVICISNWCGSKIDNMDEHQSAKESLPDYADVALSLSWYPSPPPSYALSEAQHFPPPSSQPTPAYPLQSAHWIASPLPQQPSQQHQHPEVVRPPDIVSAVLGFTAIFVFFFYPFFVSYPPSSLNGTQPKPATCSEVSAIWKHMSKIWGIPSP